MPRETYSIWDVAPQIADSIYYDVRELLGSPLKKIEVRFKGLTPLFVAILHLENGEMYAITGDAEYLGESDYEEMGFDYEKYPHISDSVAGIHSWWAILASDADLDEFKINKKQYENLKKEYDDLGLIVS
ncbi:MAG: hypothetical protein QXZ11_03190 [Thermoproteota archaeon]